VDPLTITIGLQKRGTLSTNTLGGEGIYTIDTSGGMNTITLPAVATSIQYRYIFLVPNAVIPVSIEPQSNESLNG
jgi:hypothetical protein